MAQRTIQSPGVQVFESDLTTDTPPDINSRTNVYVTGFAQQGPCDEVLQITSKQQQVQIFGTPTNSAERYFYHTIDQVLNSPANVYAVRLPYGAGKGDGFGSKYSALAYPVTAVNNTYDGSGLYGGLPTLSITDGTSGVYVLGAPLHIELTQSQFLSALAGTAFQWSDLGSSLDTFNSSSNAGVLSSLGRAGIIILNTAQTTIDGSFQGHYAGIVDNSNLNPAANYAGIRRIFSINKTGGTISGVISGGEYVEIPGSSLQFSVSANYQTGSDRSISEVMENLTDWELNTQESNDVLSLGIFKLRKTIFGDEAFKLDYVKDDHQVGSINSHRKIADPKGGRDINFHFGNHDDHDPYRGGLRVGIGIVNDTISNKISGGDALDSDGNPTNWIRLYTDDIRNVVDTAQGRSQLGFNTDTFTVLSGTLGNPRFPQAGVIDKGPDAGNLFAIGAFSNDKLSDKVAGSIPEKLERALDRVKNDESYDIDIVCEAGLGTIFAASSAAGTDYYDEFTTNLSLQQAINGMRSSTDLSGDSLTLRNNYNTIFNKFNNFCKPPYLAGGSRGDCLFIADTIRQILISGANSKTLDDRDLNFQQDVLWPLRHQFETQNSSYACTYGQWAQVYDNHLAQNVWVPFSGFAAAVMARTDATNKPWTAPAGFARGSIDTASSLALNPNQKQRDELYKASINPVAFFPGQGQVIFGQKTLTTKPTAFDRINVRRLFLALERPTKKIARQFVFEQNNIFSRTRLVNALNPLFQDAKATDGLYDYLIVCDERNNPASVVEANELKVDIYIKPVRTAEFVLVSFYADRQGTSFSELIGGGQTPPTA
tara:strand:+ start:791 stop:3265 length:2475 start_codon:yes stop_codon:yes gene_type:complete